MLEPGTLIEGQYRIDKLVGVGGMGLVYQAIDERTQQRVAVKIMRSTLDSESEVVRFHREARALGKLDHPNIVRVHQAGVLPDGEPYMVMELLVGRDLRTELRERGPLPVEEVAGYMIQACGAVAAAHAQNVIHRDIKPQNLFITQLDGDRQVKLLDFGISKLAIDGEATATGTADMLGTPHYMSPEQVRSTKDVDHRTDIWSLGVAMYFLTTGKLPFAHASPTAVIAAIPFEEPKPPSWINPDVSPPMEEIILRCLRKDPADRYRDAGELLDALKSLAPDGGVRVQGATAPLSLPTVPMPKGEGQLALAVATQRANRAKERSPAEDAATVRARPESVHSLASTVGSLEPVVPVPAAPVALARQPRWKAAALAFVLLVALGIAQAWERDPAASLPTAELASVSRTEAPTAASREVAVLPSAPSAPADVAVSAPAPKPTERPAQRSKRRPAVVDAAPRTPSLAADHNPSHL